jgi:1-acyl-sn-glycerol-3-phosphate acyltransferase
MIYLFIKKIVQWAFFVFFKKKTVNGLDNIKKNGPLIIAINHPNTLVDPLLVGSQIKRRVGFLANASIFINGFVKAIFKYFSVIPVYRKKDLKPGEVRDNASSFSKCYDFFDKDGAILIFPEGTSVNELKLRDIKTGTARIALAYEAEKGFPGTLYINTVALSYSNSLRFRSMVSMNVNKAFRVKDYQGLWEKDPEEAVRELTDRIREEIEGIITLTDNKEQERLVLQAQAFYSEYIDPSIRGYKDPEKAFALRKEIAEKVRLLDQTDPSRYTAILTMLNSYIGTLEKLNFTLGFFKDSFLRKNRFAVLLSYLIQLLIGLPFYVAGLLTNFIPYKVPDWIFEGLKVDEEYKSSISVVFGMIVFPLYYGLCIYFFRDLFTDNLWLNLLFLACLPFLGFFTLFYWKLIRRFNRVLRFYFNLDLKLKEALIVKRKDLEDLVSQL